MTLEEESKPYTEELEASPDLRKSDVDDLNEGKKRYLSLSQVVRNRMLDPHQLEFELRTF